MEKTHFHIWFGSYGGSLSGSKNKWKKRETKIAICFSVCRVSLNAFVLSIWTLNNIQNTHLFQLNVHTVTITDEKNKIISDFASQQENFCCFIKNKTDFSFCFASFFFLWFHSDLFTEYKSKQCNQNNRKQWTRINRIFGKNSQIHRSILCFVLCLYLIFFSFLSIVAFYLNCFCYLTHFVYFAFIFLEKNYFFFIQLENV